MTDERLSELLAKAENDTITPEEDLELLQELNRGIDELRSAISTLPDKEEVIEPATAE